MLLPGGVAAGSGTSPSLLLRTGVPERTPSFPRLLRDPCPRSAAGAASRGPFLDGVGTRRRMWAAARMFGSGRIGRQLPDLGLASVESGCEGHLLPRAVMSLSKLMHVNR